MSLPFGIWTDPPDFQFDLADLSSWIVLTEDVEHGLVCPGPSPPWLWLQLARSKQYGATEKPKGVESSQAETGLHVNWEAAGPTSVT